MKYLNIAEDVLIVLGVGVTLSLEQIYTIFGIVLLSIQIILILVKVTLKIIEKVKSGKIDEAVKDIEDAQQEIKDVTDKKK